MLSKACVVGAYQRKLEEIAADPELELVVAVPPFWKDERGITRLERAYTEGYRLEVLPMAFNGNFHLHFYPGFARLLDEVQPDLVHIDEEPYNWATYHANRLARQRGAKTLWFSWQNLLRQYPWPFSQIERYNLEHSDFGIVGSQTAAQIWRGKGYTGPLEVIPQFGVDPDMFSPPEQPRNGGPVHIVYAGRLVPEKGVDLLLKALQLLAGNWRATILGGGPEEARLRESASTSGIAERIMFRAQIPSIAMPDFYRQADILVLPSRSRRNWIEQFGRVLVEAMACEVAVVGSETGEIPYVIGNAGLTFPENDVAALTGVLTRLIEDVDLRRTLAKQGRARILAAFTQHRIAQATIAVYKKVVT